MNDEQPPEPQEITVEGIPSGESFGTPRLITTAPIVWVLHGFELARARFAEAAARDTPLDANGRETFIPLFEALNWIATLVDYVRKDGDGATPLMSGVTYARNRIHHGGADALEARHVEVSNSAGPFTISGMSFDDWYWRPEGNLPDPPPGREDPEGLADYAQLVAGRRAILTLDGIAEDVRRKLQP